MNSTMTAGVILIVAFVTASVAWGNPISAKVEDREQIIDPEVLRNFTLPDLHLYQDWADWESWEASNETRRLFPYYRSGYDADGLVVYVLEFGKWNYRTLVHMSAEQIEDFWRYYEQCVRRAERDSLMHDGEGSAFLVDWDCFGLEHYANGPALQSAMKMFTFFARFNDVTRYGFYINVNYAAETFMNLAKPYFENFMEKLEVYGTRSDKWKPRILRKIPASQLPPVYGGNKDWKPLPFK